MTEDFIACNYLHQPGCICGRTIMGLWQELSRYKAALEKIVGFDDSRTGAHRVALEALRGSEKQ